MSRGWESKSVESQQAEKAEPADQALGQAASDQAASDRQSNVAADAESRRRRQALELQRERILSERTSSPHRRSALTNALATVEEELAQLGWTIHL